jgi:hypothetical protein
VNGHAGTHGEGKAPSLTAGRNWDEYDEADCLMDHERSSPRSRRRCRATADIGAVIADNQPAPEPRAAASSFLIKGADKDS